MKLKYNVASSSSFFVELAEVDRQQQADQAYNGWECSQWVGADVEGVPAPHENPGGCSSLAAFEPGFLTVNRYRKSGKFRRNSAMSFSIP